MALSAAQIAALKTELNTDPRGYGFAADLASGNDSGLVAKLNLKRDGAPGNVPANPTGAGGQASGIITVFRTDIPVKEVIASIAPVDYAALTQLQISKITLQFAGTGMIIDATNANTRGSFAGIFSSMSAPTVAAVNALAQRVGSRAEELFGTGAVITDLDVTHAKQ